MRVRFCISRMTEDQADTAEYALSAVVGVTRVQVFDRTCDVVIAYSCPREKIIQKLSAFSFSDEKNKALVPEHTGRELNKQYEEKLAAVVIRRAVNNFIIPQPVRRIISVIKAAKYIFRGLIMQTLGSWFKIPVLAIVLQAIIFAMGHGYNSIGLFETLVSGLGFGFFAWKTNGIEVSSALHTANNFAVGLFVMLGLQASSSSPQLSEVAVAIVFLIVLYIIMYYVGKKTDWFGEIPENSQDI